MPLTDDGDIVKGLGFVTLYSAYAEEVIDQCAEVLVESDKSPPRRINRQPISEKIKYCDERLASFEALPAELEQLRGVFQQAAGLFEKRNDVVHGRIYAGTGGEDVRRSGRPDVPDREVTSGELYELANSMIGIRSPLLQAARFGLERLLRRQDGSA